MNKGIKPTIQSLNSLRKDSMQCQHKHDCNECNERCSLADEVAADRLLHELQVHQIELEMQQNELIVARDIAESAAANYQALYDLAPVGYVSLNRTGYITQANFTAASMLGMPRKNILGKRLGAYLTEDSLLQYNAHLANTFQGVDSPDSEIKLNIDNKLSTVQLKLTINEDGLECLSALTDITATKKSEIKLKLAASVFSHAHEGIMITDLKGNILEVNDTFTQITGFSRQEAIGKNPRIFRSGRQSADFYDGMWSTLKQHNYWCDEIWNKRKNGEIYPQMQSISAVRDVYGKVMHYVSMFTDITDKKAHQQQLEHTAHHDMLTGLPNRALLANKLAQALKQSQRRGKKLALAYLDLDGFKAINDIHGHSTGDQFLVLISQALKSALRAGDFLARIGGDEFVAVLSDLEQASDCEPVLQRMLVAASQSIICNEEILQASTSIGVTLYPQNGTDPDLLLRQADHALYQAKDAGKSCYLFFDKDSAEASKTKRKSLECIIQAYENQEFVLYFQPKVNMNTGKVVGVEALLRWQHPQQGLLLPEVFLPMIEDHLISIKIGEWVIDTVLKQLDEWQEKGLTIPVSVNIGASQLQSSDFVANLAAALTAYPNISPELLEMEILETSALEDMVKISQRMNACLQMGVKFALDDFGTGYSSLTYLKSLPATKLKIDQSFIRDMLTDTSDLAILKAIIGLADIFDLGVVAEGVETKAQADKLLSLNCTVAQGYGISKPMPAAQVPKWVQAWHCNPTWTA
ncbi:GGDEF and EAL domain-containing protein [Shewanella sp. 10N.286.52.C2]|uniref:sensor domain-containing protein n=1 Tax=Shewanella sp. 10N.286.52.C2 TaxID=1880838 RepID=UPI000C816F70|nr:GGDEF and EAL domain-containing protein [Shewanella sp. 10N.286.52.C2]